MLRGATLREPEPECKTFRSILRDAKGATAIEYGLIAALVSVAAITALQGVGDQLNTTMTRAQTQMASTNP
jgi:pilus assembly protein Flp/PilA